MRTIAVVTTGRADYSLYRPILRRIAGCSELRLTILACGMHLSPEFGMTVHLLEQDGFSPAERVEMLLSSESSEGVALSMGLGVMGFAQALTRSRPDILVVLGDRYEMFSAALAALPLTIPVAHIHGGELTEGVIDDALRHAMTKLSHLHFVATTAYAERVVRLGEEPWRVTVSGAPGLDETLGHSPLPPETLEDRFGIRLSPAPLLVTYHPETLDPIAAAERFTELLTALETIGLPVVFTQPNADAGGRGLLKAIRQFVASRQDRWLVDNFGPEAYPSMMAHAKAMVGNSSSGIIEAPSFRLPVVNIGDRQKGRLRAANVVDVAPRRDAILAGLARVLAPPFRASLEGLANPYGDGQASRRIVERLRTEPLGRQLVTKAFFDGPPCP